VKTKLFIAVMILGLALWFLWFFRYSIVASHSSSSMTFDSGVRSSSSIICAYKLDRITGKVTLLKGKLEYDIKKHKTDQKQSMKGGESGFKGE